jgi:hypothetical protein
MNERTTRVNPSSMMPSSTFGDGLLISDSISLSLSFRSPRLKARPLRIKSLLVWCNRYLSRFFFPAELEAVYK